MVALHRVVRERVAATGSVVQDLSQLRSIGSCGRNYGAGAHTDYVALRVINYILAFPFASRLLLMIFLLLSTETKVESGTSQSKSGTSFNSSHSGNEGMGRHPSPDVDRGRGLGGVGVAQLERHLDGRICLRERELMTSDCKLEASTEGSKRRIDRT